MHRFGTTRWVVLAVALFAACAAASSAFGAPVSPSGFTCGVTVFTQCNQTAHFSSTSEELTPLAPTSESGCPAFVLNDYGTLDATGNGVEHSTVNKAGDGWFTSTFTGTATITPFLDPGLTTPDPAVLPYTGHLTEWFGGSFNRSNMVDHSTFHFQGTDALGNNLNVTDIDHFNTDAANPFAPPNSFEITHCS
jgi:hypothetical protein